MANGTRESWEAGEIEAFLTDLAVRGKVAASIYTRRHNIHDAGSEDPACTAL